MDEDVVHHDSDSNKEAEVDDNPDYDPFMNEHIIDDSDTTINCIT